MNQKGAVRFEHEKPQSLGQPGRETTGIENLAAGDEQAHRPGPYCPFRTVTAAQNAS